MRRILLSAVAVSSLWSTALWAEASTVVLEVDGKKITSGEVSTRMQMPEGQSFESLPVDFQQRILQSLAVQTHMVNVATKRYADNAEVQQQVAAAQAEAPEEVKKFVGENVLLMKLRDDIVAERVNQAEEKKALTQAADQIKGDEVHIYFIRFASQAEAEKALNGVKDAAGLEALPKSERNFTGDMGYVNPVQLPKKVAKAVEPLQKGQLSKPVETEFGWQVFAVKDRRPLKKELNEVQQNEIKGHLQNQVWMQYVQQEMEKVSVTITPPAASGK